MSGLQAANERPVMSSIHKRRIRVGMEVHSSGLGSESWLTIFHMVKRSKAYLGWERGRRLIDLKTKEGMPYYK